MVDNTDAALVSDNDLDQTLHLRSAPGSNSNEPQRIRNQNNKFNTSLPGIESDDESTRLLNPVGNNVGDDDDESVAEESEYLKEFSGLPWWKRPSVCARY
jgi:hypothetical protein